MNDSRAAGVGNVNHFHSHILDHLDGLVNRSPSLGFASQEWVFTYAPFF